MDENFSQWIIKDNNAQRAGCKLCRKVIDISTMGTSGLRSHMRSEKHKLLVKQLSESSNISCYTVASTSHSISQPDNHCPTNSSSSQSSAASSVVGAVSNISSYVTRNDTLTAEIWWALKVVSSNYSFKSAAF